VVEMVGSEQLRQALRNLTHTITQAHQHVQEKDFGAAWQALDKFSVVNEAFMNACRTELGFDNKAR
jgi:hypothetical protein